MRACTYAQFRNFWTEGRFLFCFNNAFHIWFCWCTTSGLDFPFLLHAIHRNLIGKNFSNTILVHGLGLWNVFVKTSCNLSKSSSYYNAGSSVNLIECWRCSAWGLLQTNWSQDDHGRKIIWLKKEVSRVWVSFSRIDRYLFQQALCRAMSETSDILVA